MVVSKGFAVGLVTLASVLSAPSALAAGFAPIAQEGEIDVGLGCLDSQQCFSSSSLPFIESIISLTDASTGSRSRLFIDSLSTKNQYGSSVKLQKKDAGTNHQGFWFRPSEYDEATGQSEEKGQLEVGTFTFLFEDLLSSLTIDFFDTEFLNSTGVLAINGVDLSTPDWIAKGPNSNIASLTYQNVQSITLKLGNDTVKGTGDGVNFRFSNIEVAEVPEPGTLIGLMGVGALGALVTKRRTKMAENG